jgi:hypothetical protein
MQLKIFGLVGAGIFCAVTLIHPLNALANKEGDRTRAAWTPPLLLSELAFLEIAPLGWNDSCKLKDPKKYKDYKDDDKGCCIIGEGTAGVQKDNDTKWSTCRSNAEAVCDVEPTFQKDQRCH